MIFSLEVWRRDHIPAVARYANNPKIAKNLRDGFPQPYKLSDADAYVSGCLAAGDGKQLCRAIVVGGEAVGSIGIFLRDNSAAELGYWLAEPFWGHGIMAGAAGLLCAQAFARYDISRIYAIPYCHNAASCRVLEKAGFQYGGLTEDRGSSNGAVCMYTLHRPFAQDQAGKGS